MSALGLTGVTACLWRFEALSRVREDHLSGSAARREYVHTCSYLQNLLRVSDPSPSANRSEVLQKGEAGRSTLVRNKHQRTSPRVRGTEGQAV